MFLAAEMLKQADQSAFEPMMKAENLEILTTEVAKYKETIYAALPKDLEADFIAKYKSDVEKGMKGMIDYLSASFELKKILFNKMMSASVMQ